MLKIDKNFVQRALFGGLLVAVIVGGILWDWYTMLSVFGVIGMFAVREFHKLTNTEHSAVNPALPSLAAFLLYYTVFMSVSGIGGEVLLLVAGVLYGVMIFAMFLMELYRKQDNPLANWANIALGQMYVALPFALLNCLYYCGGEAEPLMLLALFVMIWCNDTCAYLFGCTFGKHRLFERISPKKSWEGFFGGVLGAMGAAYVFSLLVPSLSLIEWMGMSLVVVVFGTYGDLVESLIKRTLGVKDSGIAIPGHGGWLDRFDSMLFAAPAAVLYLLVISY